MARLEDLQYHDEDKIYEIVAKIIPKFFDLEDPLKLWSFVLNLYFTQIK